MRISFLRECFFSLLLSMSIGFCPRISADTDTLKQILRRYPTPIEELKRSFGPKDLPDFITLLEDNDMKSYWGNVVLGIGAVGGDQGVDFLVAYLGKFSGVVSDERSRALRVVPTALAPHANQGNPKALNFLLGHHTPGQWRQARLGWATPNKSADQIHRSLCQAVWQALLWSNRTEARDVISKIANDPNPEYSDLRQSTTEARDLLKTLDAIDKARKDGVPTQPVQRQSEPATKPVPADDRNRTVELTPLPAAEALALREIAITEFQKVADACMKESLENVAQYLADNGRPLISASGVVGKEDLTTRVQKLKEGGDWEKTKTLLTQTMSGGMKRANYGQASAYQQGGNTAIMIPLLGTEATRRQHLPRVGSTRTVDIEGRLNVYMIKVGDRWYWNPFGW